MGKISYASVQRRNGEEISSMLKRFKRKVEDSGHLIELRERKEFLKPSVVKRRQKQEAVRKEWLKNLKENRN
jgi:small subunit ribosomal protein S21